MGRVGEGSIGTTQFLTKMADSRASDLVGLVTSFVQQVQRKEVEPERDAQQVQEFLDTAESRLRSHELWRDSSPAELDASGEDLERYIMKKLHNRCFASDDRDRRMDAHLSARIAHLSAILQPEHLDLPSRLRNESSISVASQELRRMNQYKAPRDKLQSVLNCCRVVSKQALSSSSCSNSEAEPRSSADDILPVLILALLRANPPQLWSNIEYIRRFRGSSRLHGESMYYFTNAVSAVEFIRCLEPSQVSNIDENQVRAALERADREAPPPELIFNDEKDRQYSNGPSTQSTPSSEQQQEQQAQHSSSSNIATTHDSNAHRYEDGATASSAETHQLQQPEQQLKKTAKTCDDAGGVEELGLSTMNANGVLREHLAHKYAYLMSESDTLPVAWVPDLLKEYKQLAFKYEALVRGTQAILSDTRAQSDTSISGIGSIDERHVDSATSMSGHQIYREGVHLQRAPERADWKEKAPLRIDAEKQDSRRDSLIELDIRSVSDDGAAVDLSPTER